MNTTMKQNVATAAAVLLCATAVAGCSVRSTPGGPPERVVSIAIQQQIQGDPPWPVMPKRQIPLRQLMETDRSESAPPTSSDSRKVPLRQLMEADRVEAVPPAPPGPTIPLRQLMEADRAEVAPQPAPELREVPLRQLIEGDR